MGYALCFGNCFGCDRLFGFNPNKVPSILSPRTGQKEPVCQACVDKANPERAKNGLPPIVPAPDAYEPEPEENL